MSAMKTCIKCGKTKTLREHYRYDHESARYVPTCRTCIAEVRREQQAEELREAERKGKKAQARTVVSDGLEILKNRYWTASKADYRAALKGL